MVHGSVPRDPALGRCGCQSHGLHDTETSSWEHVATYDLPHPWPGMPAPRPVTRPVRFADAGETLYVAGDQCDTSCIQDALTSGRRAARAVLVHFEGERMTCLLTSTLDTVLERTVSPANRRSATAAPHDVGAGRPAS